MKPRLGDLTKRKPIREEGKEKAASSPSPRRPAAEWRSTFLLVSLIPVKAKAKLRRMRERERGGLTFVNGRKDNSLNALL